MEITFYGAAESVTGSQHLLDISGKKILLDCGMFQGHRKESEDLNRQFAFSPENIDTVILSHAHIDHSGNIPALVKKGFGGLIISTFATRDLAAIMLPDSAHIQAHDAEYLNKKRRKNNLPPVEPLYDINDVTEALERFVSIPYSRPYRLADDLTLRFLDAGHILGSAQIELTIRQGSTEKILLFSGDLGRYKIPILKDPFISGSPNLLIMESTYGNRLHGSEDSAEARLREVVLKAVERKSRVIIPSFSVGRTQSLLYHLHKLFRSEQLPDIQVFVDSPLSFDATEVYKLHPECYDKETRKLLGGPDNPFRFENLHFVQGVRESKELNKIDYPAIIISASGMCEAGRIRHHLKNSIEDERNIILIVGFMAENTLGRALADRLKEVKIFGNTYSRKAEVSIINGFSAHADADGLFNYASSFTEKELERIVLVHGERDQSEPLAQRLSNELSIDTHIARFRETIEF